MDEQETGNCRHRFRSVVVAIVLFYCLADVCALTFRYVEGDDARAVAYSLLGVGNELYAPMHYHSMTSMLMSFLPKQELIVRVVAIGGSAVGALCYLLLVARIAWHWAARSGLPQWLTAGVLMTIPLILPELIFLGLLYEPVMVGMSVVLLAHLVVRPAFEQSSGNGWRLIAGALLFGFGVSFRWDTGFYGSVIAMDLLVTGWKRHEPKFLVCKVAVWGVAALLAAVAALALSGYPPSTIVETYHWMKETMAVAPPMLEKLLDGVTFLTPMMLLLTGIGFLVVVLALPKSWPTLLLLIAGSPLFVIVGIPSFSAKAFLTIMPALILIMLHGADGLWRGCHKLPLSSRRVVGAGLLLLLLIPWLIGIQWKRPDTARGPGFAFSPIVSVDDSSGPRPTFAGGLGAPTPEGPRPLWGFGWVLFGGEWRSFVRSMNDEWNTAVDLAVERQLPLHQDSDAAIVMTRLMALDYHPQTARIAIDQARIPEYVHHRLYEHAQSGEQLEVILFSAMDRHLKEGNVPKVFTQLGFDEVVVVYTTPSRLRDLQRNSEGSVTARSPLTAVWNRSTGHD